MYEVIRIEPNEWYVDADVEGNRVLGATISAAKTWKELTTKENPMWHAGVGCVIQKDGEDIGLVEDYRNAVSNRYDDRTGEQYPVRLKDFMEAVESRRNDWE